MSILAKQTINPRRLNIYTKISETVCVIETLSGKVYTGINLTSKCNLGFCAEQACIAQMIKDGETCIKKILTMNMREELLPPCGKCAEYITQLDNRNHDAEFYIGEGKTKRIKDIFLMDWKNSSY